MSIDRYSDELSVFDWWKNYLGKTDLKNMKYFLEKALELGFTGYVCFKVGASGCSNGMWAHTEESSDGYSPDGPCLYRSFTPDYTKWNINKGKGFQKQDYLSITEIEKEQDIEAEVRNDLWGQDGVGIFNIERVTCNFKKNYDYIVVDFGMLSYGKREKIAVKKLTEYCKNLFLTSATESYVRNEIKKMAFIINLKLFLLV